MKKVILCIAIIIATVVSVAIMLIDSGGLILDSKDNYSGDTNIKENIEGVQDNKEINKSQQGKIESGKVTKSEVQNSTKKDGTITEKNSTYNNNETVTKNTEISKTENKKNVDNSSIRKNDVVILKVPKEEIQNKITIADKATLITIASKISPVDYAIINNHLRDENTSNGIINILVLLRKRLSSKDFEKFKEVATKFIHLEKLDTSIMN